MTRGDETGSAGPSRPERSDILEWEVVERRILIPPDLQLVIGAPTPIIRVRREIDLKQRTKHADTFWCYQRLSALLREWEYIRYVQAHLKWEIAQFVTDVGGEQWPLLTVIGRDRVGSYNLISSHRKNERWGRKLRNELLEEFMKR